jgi:hypothetical protein
MLKPHLEEFPMPSVPITIVGTWTNADGTSVGGTLEGSASITGLGVGGGPILPPEKPPGIWGPPDMPPGIWPPPGGRPPQPPLGIWGPPDMPPGIWPPPGQRPPSGGGQPPGQPTFPIWGPPGVEFPPGSGYPPVAGHPLPEPPTEGAKPIPNWEAKAVWIPPAAGMEASGWAVVIVPKEGATVPTPSHG